jgi:hypothetical protein
MIAASGLSARLPQFLKLFDRILGHSSVVTTVKVYQRTMTEDFRSPPDQIASPLLPDVTKPALAN